MIRSTAARAFVLTATAALTCLLAACGGGGGGGGGGTTTPVSVTQAPAETDPRSDAVMGVVGFYDALTGLERLMATANGDAQLVGAPGQATVTSCGSGSITTQKTGTTTFVLTATNCKLSGARPLVYNGNYALTLRPCTSFPGCRAEAVVDYGAARFGYGVAKEQVVGSVYGVPGDGSPGVIFAPGDVMDVEGTQITVSGTSTSFKVTQGGNVVIWTGRTGTDHDSRFMNQPLRGSLALNDSGVTATIDGSGTVVVPWSAFID